VLRRKLRAGSLLALLALAGCLGPPTEVSAPAQPPPADAHLLPLPGILLEDCTGARLSLLRPEPGRTDHVPDAFRPSAGLPLSAGFGVDYLSCARVVAFDAVRTGAQLLWAWAHVNPKNASWTDSAADSFFTYEVLTDDPGLALALRSLGMPAEVATVMPRPPAMAAAGPRGVTFGTDQGSVALEWTPIPGVAAPEPKLEFVRHQWSEASNGFVRLRAQERDEFALHDSQTPGRVAATGEGAFARRLGTLPAAGLGLVIPRATWEISGESSLFKRETP